jgi:hypothetical protein
MSTPVFQVFLHHLTPDAQAASIAHGDRELPAVTPERLQTLLTALAAVAARDDRTAMPELRIIALQGRFLVQARDGRLLLHSWKTRPEGLALKPEHIFAVVTGAGAEADFAAAEVLEPERRGSLPRPPRPWLKLALLAALIVGINAVTVWLLLRPAPDLLPPYELLPAAATQQLLTDAAGDYETGAKEGDRGLRIAPDGSLRLVKFGPNHAVVEEVTLTAQGAQTGGQPVLITSDRTTVEIKDAATVVLYGDTYRRTHP